MSVRRIIDGRRASHHLVAGGAVWRDELNAVTLHHMNTRESPINAPQESMITS
jgi:hypothetical protein